MIFHHVLRFLHLLFVQVIAHLLSHFLNHFRIVLHFLKLLAQIEYANKEAPYSSCKQSNDWYYDINPCHAFHLTLSNSPGVYNVPIIACSPRVRNEQLFKDNRSIS